MFGLDKQTIEQINQVFVQNHCIEKVVLYGSRAMGNYKHGSDIDISLFGDNLSLKTVYAVEELLFELYLPYTFDISIFEQISNKELLEHILEEGKIFYAKEAGQDRRKI